MLSNVIRAKLMILISLACMCANLTAPGSDRILAVYSVAFSSPPLRRVFKAVLPKAGGKPRRMCFAMRQYHREYYHENCFDRLCVYFRSIFNYYIVSLCVSDIISALLNPLFLYRRIWGYDVWEIPYFFCKVCIKNVL